MHVVKYERKKPPFVFHCKFACAVIIDNINHYSKCIYIYIYIYTMLIKTNYPKYSVVWYSHAHHLSYQEYIVSHIPVALVCNH